MLGLSFKKIKKFNYTASVLEHGGCFIATVAFGTPLAQEILILLNFRDNISMPSAMERNE